MAEMRDVVVTGISTGIGHARPRSYFFQRGFAYSGRCARKVDADRLQRGLVTAYVPLIMDIFGRGHRTFGSRSRSAP